MASWNARPRDPLFDSATRSTLERRGKELIGLGMLLLAALAAAMLGSYTPDDPNWMAATDAPAQNLMGRLGAGIASALFILVGHGAWGIVLVLCVWGLRFLLHRGGERAPARLIFAPIAVAVGAVYAATLVPGPGWEHSFGLGGLFGDTVLGALLGILPVPTAAALKTLSFLIAGVLLVLGLFVTGWTLAELRGFGRFLLFGLLVAYDGALSLLARGLRGAGSVALRLGRLALAALAGGSAALSARRDTVRTEALAEASPAPPSASGRAERQQPRLRAEPQQRPAPPLRSAAPSVAGAPAANRPRGGLLARLPDLVRRNTTAEPVPELVETEGGADAEAPGEDRIRARIADVIRARRRADPGPAPARTPTALRPEPPLRPDATAVVADTAPPAPSPRPETIEEPPEEGAAAALFDDPAAPPAAPAAGPGRAAALRGLFGPRKVVQPPARRSAAPSRRAQAESQPTLDFDGDDPSFELPPLSLLTAPESITRHPLSQDALEENARMLETVLDDYGVKGEIVSVRPGPVVTLYELEPAPGLKASRVIGLADDIARSMSALSARVSTVPGRSVIGIELPNAHREKVVLREILSARDYGDSQMRLPLALGKGIGGEPIVANLAKMPHLLIAGTTGSGKSVAINTMILSLLYRLAPEECRLIMIDPKMLELSVYDGIPHLLSPVVTDPKKAVVALKWVVAEMEDRYRKMSKMGVRNIEGYNGRVREALARGEMFKRTIQTGFDDETGDPVFETEEFAPELLPFIVVIVDEMADLMMVAGKEIEACIQRLAQMARASGIHLIMATQRPSVDVITGTIKANFPTRISFQVTSKIDSRTILGEQGAEQLLGMGDMLYMAGGSKITRVHGPFVSDEEVEDVVRHLKSFGPPEYMSGVVEGPDSDKEADIDLVLGLGESSGDDALYDQAVAIVARDRKCSTSYIQRKLGIGYNKAARLVEQMEDQGVVTPANHVGKREILVPEA